MSGTEIEPSDLVEPERMCLSPSSNLHIEPISPVDNTNYTIVCPPESVNTENIVNESEFSTHCTIVKAGVRRGGKRSQWSRTDRSSEGRSSGKSNFIDVLIFTPDGLYVAHVTNYTVHL